VHNILLIVLSKLSKLFKGEDLKIR
jgi:hypothetical protein